MPLFPSTPPSSPPPSTPPPNTPPINYDDPNIHGFTPPSNDDSQYSSDYNDEWDNYMNNPNVTRRRQQNSSTPILEDNDDDFIQGRELFMDDLNDADSQEEDENESSDLPDFEGDKSKAKPWGNKEMPPTPSYSQQIIDVDAEGYDPFLMDNQKISDYIKEDSKENVVIIYNGKYYLSTRAIIEQQEDEALVYECIETKLERYDGVKEYQNIVGNLPLYNIKKIGIDISSDNAVGIEAEYIYMEGIDELLSAPDAWPYYSIIPLPDKMLVSVISKNEALKIGSGFSGVSALHCQAGQGGLPGILVKAYPNKEVVGGRKARKSKKNRKTKTKKSRKTKTKKSRKTKTKKSRKTKKTMKQRK